LKEKLEWQSLYSQRITDLEGDLTTQKNDNSDLMRENAILNETVEAIELHATREQRKKMIRKGLKSLVKAIGKPKVSKNVMNQSVLCFENSDQI